MTKTELDAAVAARLAEVNAALGTLDDETAVNVTALFPAWEAGVSYDTGARVRYDDKLYKCVQAHVSQTGWEPPTVPALWTEVAAPGVIPVWKQPTGAQDAYNIGDKVHYPDAAGDIYVSTIDNNVWEPGVYGWEVVG